MIFVHDALAGRTALVTGGSRGIGRAIVATLAGAGAEVIFCGRSAATGEAMQAELVAKGLAVRFLAADVESEEGIDALAEAAGPVDILVNNVGGAHDAAAGLRPFDAIPPGDWAKTYMKCVFSAVRTSSITPCLSGDNRAANGCLPSSLRTSDRRIFCS